MPKVIAGRDSVWPGRSRRPGAGGGRSYRRDPRTR